MKTDILFAGVNVGMVIQKKKRQENAHFMDEGLKIMGIKYLR